MGVVTQGKHAPNLFCNVLAANLEWAVLSISHSAPVVLESIYIKYNVRKWYTQR